MPELFQMAFNLHAELAAIDSFHGVIIGRVTSYLKKVGLQNDFHKDLTMSLIHNKKCLHLCIKYRKPNITVTAHTGVFQFDWLMPCLVEYKMVE